jgi:uncharacterized protein (DUF1800 family)
MLANYEQDVIRPRAMGRFEDLLVATAKSPAMLFYLDNWLSVGPGSTEGARYSGEAARAVCSALSTASVHEEWQTEQRLE